MDAYLGVFSDQESAVSADFWVEEMLPVAQDPRVIQHPPQAAVR